jgi:hypothetical protein
MWDETGARDDGTIMKEPKFPTDLSEWIISGPHFYVANPLYKSPRRVCNEKADYDVIDLETIPNDYVPRTKYTVGCEPKEYERRVPKVPWTYGDKSNVTNFYRLFCRAMISIGAEKGLISAIFPPGVAHINGARSYAFKDENKLLEVAGCTFSILWDFFVKLSGRSNLHQMLDDYPILTNEDILTSIRSRVLRLISLTSDYKELWERHWDDMLSTQEWTRNHPCLDKCRFKNCKSKWDESSSLRNDQSRRQALIEIDVLTAMGIGLSLNELQTIYRAQLSVLRQYEFETTYDINGRIVFTPSKGLVGVGLSRKANKKENPLTIEYLDGKTEEKPLGWEDIAPKADGSPTLPDGTKIHRTIIDDTLPGGPREKVITYEAPFYRPDREDDYRIAWEVFTERFVKQEAKVQSSNAT